MTLLSLLLFVACLFITSYIILLRTMREQTLQMKSKKEKLEQELYDYHEAKKNGFYYITKKDFDIALQEKFEAFMRNASEDMYNQSNGMINTSVHFAKEELFKIYKSKYSQEKVNKIIDHLLQITNLYPSYLSSKYYSKFANKDLFK